MKTVLQWSTSSNDDVKIQEEGQGRWTKAGGGGGDDGVGGFATEILRRDGRVRVGPRAATIPVTSMHAFHRVKAAAVDQRSRPGGGALF